MSPKHVEGAAVKEDGGWLPVSSRCLLAEADAFLAEMARILESHLFLLASQPDLALKKAEEAELFRSTGFGHPLVTDTPLWLGLPAAKCWVPALAEAEHGKLVGYLDQGILRFQYFAEKCAESFGHKLRLLEAEKARTEGRLAKALPA